MRRLSLVLAAGLLLGMAVLLPFTSRPRADEARNSSAHAYLGFDLNLYPGDAALSTLRKTFVFAGYWLSPPPGAKTNSWMGKREKLRQKDFGFLVLYRGRGLREVKTKVLATNKGTLDATAAIASAKREGFPPGTIIFLDIEEGGRLPASYHIYLRYFSETVRKSGYRMGAYCSGMPVKEEPGVTITTAEDIRNDDATTRARRRPDVRSRKSLRRPTPVAFPTPPSGNLRNRHAAKNSPPAARQGTTRMEIATRPAIPPAPGSWMSVLQPQPIRPAAGSAWKIKRERFCRTLPALRQFLLP